MKYIAKLNGKEYEIELIKVPEYEMRPRTGQRIVAPEAVQSEIVNKPEEVKTHSGKYVVECPLPGKVLGVKVNVGDLVNLGDVVVTIEAMKMETEILAKENGKVSQINVKAGDTVNTGEVLIIIND